MNKQFPTNENSPEKLLLSLTTLIQGLVQRVVTVGCKEDFLTVDVEKHLHPKLHLGYGFENKISKMRIQNQLTVEEEKIIRRRCILFIISLIITQLQQRLPDNSKILQNIVMVAPEKCLRSKNRHFPTPQNVQRNR